ncbi:unnamed protein product [Paramecium octaurelia]|uniref:Uncharacterized protein n=1 Tax=Paramecium octaurelia TaxID=43137 RepID=A0A8S1WLA2_PAROT|nr:unnamed protein product [Paramecium octaurelia]
MNSSEYKYETEIGDTRSSVTQQLLAKYAFKCEMCFILQEEKEQIQQESQQDQIEVRLVAAKVTSESPIRKSYIVICPKDFQDIEYNLDKFLERSLIRYSVSQLEIKKAKLVKIPNIDLNQAREKISGNYCCRVLQLRYIKADKQIQLLNTNDLGKTMENVLEIKKKALELTKKKFEQYTIGEEKMTEKQKFLIFHYYKRLERKAGGIYADNQVKLLPDANLSTLSMSISGLQNFANKDDIH